MDFLKRNSGKIALLAIIAFFTLPFIYGNEEEEDFSPFAVRSGMSYQTNPISNLASKIASFYGFSTPHSKNIMASAAGVGAIKEKVSFSKESSFGQPGKIHSQDKVFIASSRNFKNFDTDFLDSDASNSTTYKDKNISSKTSYNNQANNPVKGYVTVNGQDYAVIENAAGEKYIVTPKGHIPYEELLTRNVSEQEFINAKKRLAGASDMEILAALQQEKEKQAYLARVNNQNSNGGYTSGVISNMGGNNYVSASTQDKGFDDNALSNAYADLKNINLKIEGGTSTSSAVGEIASLKSGILRDSFDANATSKGSKSLEQKAGLTPQGIAQQAKSSAKQELIAKNDKLPKTQKIEEQSSPIIMKVQSKDNGVYEKTENNSNAVFISVKEGKVSPYTVWGEPEERQFSDGQERYGIIAPIEIQSKHGNILTTQDKSETVQQAVESISKNIQEIEEMTFDLQDKKIYIDVSTMDELSKILLLSRSNLLDYITDDPEKASIVLPGPICTPDSFQQFVKEFKKQQTELAAEQEMTPAA